MKRKKKLFWFVLISFLLLIVLTGFTKNHFLKEESKLDLDKLRIGYINRDTIIALKEKQFLEQKLKRLGVTVEWIEFQDDVSIYKALEQGKLDFGKVGDAVPAFLQQKSKNAPIYLAAEPASSITRAIAVSAGSKIKTVKDLIGKKVAYTKYSNEHYFLLQLLAKSDLGVQAIDDIKSVEATPAEAKRLFDQGKVDAWIASEPEVSLLEDGKVPLILDNELQANADVYVTTEENINQRKQLFQIVLDEIYEFDEYLTNDFHLAAEDLFQGTGIKHKIWLSVFEKETYGVSSLLDGMIKEQQQKVDFLVEQKVIKENYEVKDYVRVVN